jgi:hypothetical protein
MSHPRINYKYLSQYRGGKVLIVGIIDTIEGNTITLSTTDMEFVKIKVKNDLLKKFSKNDYVEFRGTVNNDLSISADTLTVYNDICKYK